MTAAAAHQKQSARILSQQDDTVIAAVPLVHTAPLLLLGQTALKGYVTLLCPARYQSLS